MGRPLVSIITPTYNHERFIGQCIESVLAQTYPHWEMIIVDDGSTDRTPEIIKQYDDHRIRYYRVDHQGLHHLFKIYNTALSLAVGELIAILEGDDLWPKHKLEKQVEAFTSNDIILVWGQGIVVNERGRPIYTISSVKTARKFEELMPAAILRMARRSNPIVPSSTVMVRKSSLTEVGGFWPSPSGIYVDLPTWLRLASCCQGSFRFVNMVLGYWRRHPYQATATTLAQQLMDHAELIRQYEVSGYGTYSRYLRARAALIAHHRRTARRLFADLIADSALDRRDRVICLAGFISTFTPINLVEIVLYLRQRMARILSKTSLIRVDREML